MALTHHTQLRYAGIGIICIGIFIAFGKLAGACLLVVFGTLLIWTNREK